MTDPAINQAAAALGRKGGSVTTQAKADASRRNGCKPKKVYRVKFAGYAETLTEGSWNKCQRFIDSHMGDRTTGSKVMTIYGPE